MTLRYGVIAARQKLSVALLMLCVNDCYSLVPVRAENAFLSIRNVV